MHKRILLSVFILFACSSFKASAQKTTASKGFHIKVTVKGVPKDSLCHLAYYFGDKQYLIDSAKADANSTVIFKADTLLPGGIYLFVVPGKRYFELVMDKEQRFEMVTDTIDYVNHMVVTGSKDNIVFYDYLKFIGKKAKEMEALRQEFEMKKDNPAEKERIQKQMEMLNNEVIQNKKDYIENNPDALMSKVFLTSKDVDMPEEKPKKPDGSVDSAAVYYYYKEHFFDNIDMTDARLLRTPVLFPKIEQWIKKLTIQIPDSVNAAADKIISLAKPSPDVFKFLVWWITNQYETSNIMGMDAVFVHMAKNYYTKSQAFWADSTTLYKINERASILDPILIGKKMRSMVLKDTAGVYRSLYDIKKPFTVLLVWDPDCGHCKTTVPKVKTLYDKSKAHGVEVYALNNEAERDKWLKFIKEHNLNWINVADMDFQNNFRYELDIKSTPQIFLLDENKTIIAKKIDVETLSEILEQKLGIPLKMERDEKEKAHQEGH